MQSPNNEWTEIRNTKILSNTAHRAGGVKFLQNGDKILIENVLVSGNHSETGPGGIYSFDSKISMINSTVADNHTDHSEYPGGVYASNYGKANIVNSIISQNVPFNLGVGSNDNNLDTVYVSHSLVTGGQSNVATMGVGILDWVAGNIDAVVDFDDDYSLLGY